MLDQSCCTNIFVKNTLVRLLEEDIERNKKRDVVREAKELLQKTKPGAKLVNIEGLQESHQMFVDLLEETKDYIESIPICKVD